MLILKNLLSSFSSFLQKPLKKLRTIRYKLSEGGKGFVDKIRSLLDRNKDVKNISLQEEKKKPLKPKSKKKTAKAKKKQPIKRQARNRSNSNRGRY